MRLIYITLVTLITVSCSNTANEKVMDKNDKLVVLDNAEPKICKGISNNQLDSIVAAYRNHLAVYDEGRHSEDKIFIQFVEDKEMNKVTISSSPGFPYLMDTSLIMMSFTGCPTLFVIDDLEQTISRQFYLRTETTEDFEQKQPDYGSYNDINRKNKIWSFVIDNNSRLVRIP